MLSLIEQEQRLEEIERNAPSMDVQYIRNMTPADLHLALGRYSRKEDLLYNLNDELGDDIDEQVKKRISRNERETNKSIAEVEKFIKELDALASKTSVRVDRAYNINDLDMESYNAGVSNIIQLTKTRLSAIETKFKMKNTMVTNGINERKMSLSERKSLPNGGDGNPIEVNKGGLAGGFAKNMLINKGTIRRDGRHMGAKETTDIAKNYAKTEHNYAKDSEMPSIDLVKEDTISEDNVQEVQDTQVHEHYESHDKINGEEPEELDDATLANIKYLSVESECERRYFTDPIRGIGWVVAVHKSTGETFHLNDPVALFKDSDVNWDNNTIADANGKTYDVVEADYANMPNEVQRDWDRFIDDGINPRGVRPLHLG